jgi:hypothetical protein
VGFEPTNGGFADLSLGPLGYRAELASIANLGNIAGALTSRFAETLSFPIRLGEYLDPKNRFDSKHARYLPFPYILLSCFVRNR